MSRPPLRRIARCTLLTLGASFALAAAALAATDPSPDGIWRPAAAAALAAPIAGPSGARVFDIDGTRLQEVLARVPEEGAAEPVPFPRMTLPVAGGRYAWFTVQPGPVFGPELAAAHPEIRAFIAQGVDDRTLTATIVHSPAGFHAFLRTPDGMLFMEPNGFGNTGQSLSYQRSDLVEEIRVLCEVTGSVNEPEPGLELSPRPAGGQIAPSGPTLSTYRLAVSATGEFTQFFDPGGGSANTLTQIAASVAAVNAIYMPEVTVRFQVVCTNVFTDPTTDPFTDAENSSPSLNHNQASTDAVCGSAAYDIGHVFHRRSGGGFSGLAGGLSCNNANKARGYSSVNNPVPATMIWVVDQLSHEMGHQMSADHSFNSDVTGCSGNRVGPSAYEPGSGSTIMSYAAGTRCQFDFPGTNDAYFHGHSFDQITNHRDGAGNCRSTSATGNTAPTVSAGADYTIPQGTPFVLTASGADADGDGLTYCWEQFDLGSPGDFATNVNGPLFRSRPPVPSAARTFPAMGDILAGNPTPTEILPLVDRTLNFRCTVRDNRASGGGVHNDAMVITVSGAPFALTAPNGGETLHAGCTTNVTWDVGGGSVAATVNIKLSKDGGLTFPITLAANVTNDGSHPVTWSCDDLTTQGRILVEAVGNIFFDVSNANVRIQNDDPVASMDATGGDVGPACTFLAPYTATITDDCGVDATDVVVTATSLDGLASVGVPTVNVAVQNATSVQVSGAVLVSALTGCPANVRVSITAKDNCGATHSASEDIQVMDTTPPSIQVTLNRYSLWPPNHKLATIHASVEVEDNCPNTSWTLVSATSDEPEDGLGDGDTGPDIVGADLGTADTELQLRSERSGKGDGRDYTLVFAVSDGCGNTTQSVQHVLVSHDSPALAAASDGFSPTGEGVLGEAIGLAVIVLGVAPEDGVPVEDRGPEDVVRARTAAGDPRLRSGLDPRRIDTQRIALGNVADAVRPASWRWMDANDDQRMDGVFWFDEAALRAVREAAAEADAGSVGLQFLTREGLPYLVPDVFALGAPLPLPFEVRADLGVPLAVPVSRPASPGTELASSSPTMLDVPAHVTSFAGVRPNPWTASGTVHFQLAHDEDVAIAVYDLRGARVRTVAAGLFAPGPHSLAWDGRDDAGRKLPGGLYVVRFTTAGFARSQKVLILP